MTNIPQNPSFVKPNHSRIIYWACLICIILLGLWLRFRDLGRSSFWLDEILGAEQSMVPILDILPNMASNKPPLFYYFEHLALQIKENEFFARLPAAIFGILCIFANVLVAMGCSGYFQNNIDQESRWHEKWQLILFSGILIAISPYHLRYSQEARPYIMMYLGLLLVLGFFLLILKRQKDFLSIESETSFPYPWQGDLKWLWLGFIISSIVSMLTLYFVAVSIGMIALFLLIRLISYFIQNLIHKNPTAHFYIKQDLISLGMILLTLILIYIALTPMRANISKSLAEPEMYVYLDLSLKAWARYFNIFAVGYNEWEFMKIHTIFHGSILFFPFAAIGLIAIAKQNKWLVLFFILQTIVTFVILHIAYYWKNHFMQARYLMASHIIWPVLIGWGLFATGKFLQKFLPQKAKVAGLIAPLLIICSISVVWIINTPSIRPDYRGLVQFIKQLELKNSAILSFHFLHTHSINYYLKRFDLDIPIHTLEHEVDQFRPYLNQYDTLFMTMKDISHNTELIQEMRQFPEFSGKFELINLWIKAPIEQIYSSLYSDPDFVRTQTRDFEKHLSMDIGNEKFYFLGSGWGSSESNENGSFRWCTYLENDVHFCVSSKRDLEMTIRCSPLVYTNWPGQQFDVVLNEKVIDTVVLTPGLKNYTVSIKAENLNIGFNRMIFRLARIDRVSDVLPISGDTRKLGIQFYEINFYDPKKL